MKLPMKLILILIGAVTMLTACTQRSTGNQVKVQSVPVEHMSHTMDLDNPSLIPRIDGPKIRTTNEYGNTTYGLGSSVYSLIGSSGLHSNGFSSHLESRLSGDGVNGVQVFVFDDTVILAAESRYPTGSKYDPMQQKVLSDTGGMAAIGKEPNRDIGTKGAGNVTNDNLSEAEQRIRTIMGGNVKVLTTTGPRAVELIKRMRTNAVSSASSKAVADDFQKLLRMTSQSKG
jgi:hypothetical protein